MLVPHLTAVILTLTSVLLVVSEVRGQGCDPYRNFPSHTMCIYREKACPGFRLMRIGLTASQKQTVVDVHNKLRQDIVNGRVSGAPAAVSMKYLTWDDELARVAQRMADQCKFQHDENRNVARFYVGQNIYMSWSSGGQSNTDPDMAGATNAWFNEVYNPGFPAAYIKPFKFVSGAGHYTQIAWADTSTIGCGYSMFEDNGWFKRLIYCNYGPGGNMIGGTMYEKRNSLRVLESENEPSDEPVTNNSTEFYYAVL